MERQRHKLIRWSSKKSVGFAERCMMIPWEVFILQMRMMYEIYCILALFLLSYVRHYLVYHRLMHSPNMNGILFEGVVF